MKYLEHNERFAGTGEKNENGQTLDEFLEAYNPKKYDCPCSTVDTLVFRTSGQDAKTGSLKLKLLMIRRKNHPSIGFWALPGGFVDLRENLEDSAKRELYEETGVKGVPVVQLKTYGDYDRDPRWRVITTAFIALLDEEIEVKAGDDAKDALWLDVSLSDRKDGSKTIYTLTLTSGERDLCIGAVTEEIHSKDTLLHERKLSLISSDKIAADHGIIITEAILWLRDRIN